MKRIEIIRMESPNRAPFVVEGFLFGEEGPSLAIVGAMTGDAVNQLFVASSLVDYLKTIEDHGKMVGRVLIIPAINTYALNMGETFWPLDKTDIGTMFPGYDQGETTQRIAAKLFEALQGYDYGVVLEARRDKAFCVPYVKMARSGYEDMSVAMDLGLRFIHHRDSTPIETVMLPYNWQLWGTKAVSIVFGNRGTIDTTTTQEVIAAAIRLMAKRGIIRQRVIEGYQSNVTMPDQILVVKAVHSGIFDPVVSWGCHVAVGDTLARITDALTGEKLEKLVAPKEGIVSCMYNHSLIFQNSIAFRIVSIDPA